MKKIRLYIPNILLTLLLVFLLMGSEGTMLAKRVGLNANTFLYISDHQALDQKGYEAMTSYFKTRSNSTGIPEHVYLDAVSQADLRTGIFGNISAALSYLDGSAESYTPSMDFTALESGIHTFFETYADENGYDRDEVFDEKVQSAVNEAEAEILNLADPFKFSSLQANGWLAKLRHAVSYLNLAAVICIAGAALVIVLLILCNLRQPEHLCYWIGLAGFTAGLLMAAPCIYLTASNFYAGFAIKDPQIFAAVVGLLGLLTSRALTMAIVTLLVGIIGIAGFAFLRAVQREEDEDPEEI